MRSRVQVEESVSERIRMERKVEGAVSCGVRSEEEGHWTP